MNKQMIDSEVQQNVDRLCQIIANYVRLNDLPYSLLEDLDELWPKLKASESNKEYWDDSFTRAKKLTTKFV